MGDEAAFQRAFEAFSPEEQQRVATILQTLRGQQEAVGEEQAADGTAFVSQFEPLPQAIAAVAQGNLTQTVRMDVDGRPLEGEFLRSADIVNTMIQQLSIVDG